MSRWGGLNGRRIALGALVGFGIGMLPVLAGYPVGLAAVGPFVAGVPVGLCSRSRYDHITSEAVGAGAVAAVLLYAGWLVVLAARTWGLAGQGSFLFFAGTLGWMLLLPSLVVFGAMGFFGGRLSRPVGRRLRG
jgi:hypothetical protein